MQNTSATEQQSKLIERTHKQELLIFEEFLCVGKSLKHPLTNTIEPIYMASLKNELNRFNNVNVIHIMDYVCTSYVRVDEI